MLREFESNIPHFIENFISNPLKYAKIRTQPLSIDELRQIKDLFIKKQQYISNNVILGGEFQDVLIVGDTHGFLKSTLRITKPFLNKEVNSLLFLGDYVDRGPHSLINLLYLLSLYLAWPKNILLLRGNHEDLSINGRYGFKEELKTLYSAEEYEEIEKIIEEIYEYMSLIAITPHKSIAVHAGIPNNLESIKDISQIPKPHSAIVQKFSMSKKLLYFYPILEQLRWNDPRKGQKRDFIPSNRGDGFYFYNQAVVEQFLQKNNAKRVIRSHESRRGGYDNLFNGKLIHIFSTEPYFEYVPTAYTVYETKDGQSSLRNLDFQIEENNI